jgi:hypothetical protein
MKCRREPKVAPADKKRTGDLVREETFNIINI